MEPDATESAPNSEQLDARALGRLKWRCRRGLLENDLILERFFQRHEERLTARQGAALGALMELSDNDLLDLNLSRKTLAQVAPALDSEDVRELLRQMQPKP
ncbi:MAG: Succinate dehydrogenase flavin-adding protein, antitoxin of CptAB toxin-antitoxin [Burkholderiaceae bacterium]|jgi:antitoxin CptB|nr:MAG: Succinate dehydrogenase flavin-adding protein, antitoxin of CptAB toxin-antitoxin [Burkholderiaceae bacterium]